MKTIVYIGTSLDGYIAGKDGDIEWLTQYANEEAIVAFEELMVRIDAIVMGKNTFEKVLTFPTWPYEKKVFVLSNSMKEIPEHLIGKATLLSMRPAKLLQHLSENGFKTIYVDGGKVIQDFLKDDLIDELIISKAPVIIGKGIPLFGEMDTMFRFKHNRTAVQSNGLVRSYYERAG
ncbi:MAG: dihydrofolate reductase family protein [Chitinophagales bacterium]